MQRLKARGVAMCLLFGVMAIKCSGESWQAWILMRLADHWRYFDTHWPGVLLGPPNLKPDCRCGVGKQLEW